MLTSQPTRWSAVPCICPLARPRGALPDECVASRWALCALGLRLSWTITGGLPGTAKTCVTHGSVTVRHGKVLTVKNVAPLDHPENRASNLVARNFIFPLDKTALAQNLFHFRTCRHPACFYAGSNWMVTIPQESPHKKTPP